MQGNERAPRSHPAPPAGHDDEASRLRAELDREHEKLKALQEIGAALGSTLDMDELLALVVDRVSKVMKADRSTLYLVDEDAGELWSKVAQGEGGADRIEIRMTIGQGIAGWVAAHGTSVTIHDAYKDSRFVSTWDSKTGYQTRSMLCVPMKNRGGRTIGVVQVLNKADGPFTPEDEALLQALAAQAAVSVENSKLFRSLVEKNKELLEAKEQREQKIRELDVLFEVAQEAASAMRLDGLLDGVLHRAVQAIDAEAGSILLVDEVGDLRFRAAVGGEAEKVKKLRIKAGQGISGWVAQNQEPQIVHEAEEDDRHFRAIADEVGYHPRSVLCVPLRWEGGVGALELLNKGHGQDRFTEDDVKLASVIAGHISNAIGMALRREERERGERLTTIGQLLSSVLHDLKTPMTVVSGYVNMLVGERDEETRRAYGEIVLKQVRFVNAMTREILAFARGEKTVLLGKVYVQRFFEDMHEQLEQELEGKHVRLELVLRDKGIAHLDPPKVQRAVHNLVRNAAEAIESEGTPSGTITIVVDRRDDQALVVSVSDNGPGIPDEIRARMFESFTTHGKTEGTGLGLAIVRKIVADHGGTVDVQSAPGSTTFTLVFPDRSEAATGSDRAGSLG